MAMTPIDTVKAIFTAMETKDYTTALTFVADNCVYENLPSADLGGIGPAGILAVLEPFFAPVIRNEFVWLREASAGNTVFLERLDRHLLATGWVELPVNGVFEVENGKLTVWRDYFDMATIMAKWPQPGA